MAHKRMWYGTIAHVARRFVRPEEVSVSVRLNEGVPAKDIGRVVEIRLTPQRALDWSAELATQARSARYRNNANGDVRYTAPTGESLTRHVERLLRDFAEDTGVQDDDLHAQVLDLVVELLKIAGRDGIDIEWLADKARQEAWEAENDLYNRYDRVGEPRPTT